MEDSMKTILKVGFGAFLTAGLLGCPSTGNGKLFFADNEAALLDGPGNQNYALGDKIDFRVTAGATSGVVLDDKFTSASQDATALNVESTTFSDNGTPDLDDDALRIQATTLIPGLLTLEVSDVTGTAIDFTTFNVVAADGVLVHPIQFDAQSNKFVNGGVLNVFLGSNVSLFTRLDSASNGELRGQIAGTVTSDDIAVGLSIVQDIGFELGERFIGALNGTPQSLVSVEGLDLGVANVDFSDAAGSFLESVVVNVVPLVTGAVELEVTADGQDPAAPAFVGSIKASSKLAGTNEEVFGGEYVFVEVTPNGPILNLTQSTGTQDFVIFDAQQSGEAVVEVDLVDNTAGVGNVVEQTFVTVNVTN
jgi:hypothetical protein